MYGIVLMASLASGCGWGGCSGAGFGSYYGACLGPCLPTGPNSGGRFHIGLFEGWGVEDGLTAEETKRWTDYIERLEGTDRQNLERSWESADPEARRRLLKKLQEAEKRWAGKAAEKNGGEAGISAEELKRWDAYLKGLDAAKRKTEEERWKKASLKEKRTILEKLPKIDE